MKMGKADMRIRFLLLVLLAFAGSLGAQPGPGGGDRARVERQLRQRMAEVVQQRLGLTREQMQQLNAANRTFDQNRVALLNQERRVRSEIRDQIEAGDKGSQDRIAALLDSTLLLERRRLDLMESEQNELKKFLTPRQRAQYFGLQTQMRNRMEQMRRNRPGGMPRRMPEE
jgi:Spy/CpxP family protein refolding chaperone